MKSFFLLAAVLVPATFAFGQSTSNNTSACSANGVPTAGCNGVGIMPFLGNPSNTGAQTTTIDPLPTNVSTVNVKNYLYSGATTRLMVEYQPWFSNTGGFNGHKNNGMQESTAAQALAQAQWMKTIGADVTDVDYYGCSTSCTVPQSGAQAYNLSVTTALANAIAANPSTTPKFMIMLDAGAIDSTGTGQCPPAGGDQSACLIAAIEAQMDYMAAHWFFQSYYETNAANGHPIMLFFVGHGPTSGWPGTNFNTVFSAVAAHATAGQSCGSGCTYASTIDLVDENAGGFSETGIAGAYAWPQANYWSATNQFCYLGQPCSFDYLGDFYSHARAASTKIAMGLIYKGFDDHNAAWGLNRVTAQQCGQVLNLTGAKIGASGYSSSSQLQYVQIATWNDYEEATEVETGVNNCITVATPTIAGGNISWSLIKSDATYAVTSTINSFSIYTGTSSPTTLYASGISPTATSYTAPALSAGQSAWVYMVGQPLIQNQLSPPVTPSFFTLTASVSGAGSGSVSSSPAGISCPSSCTASYASGTVVTLTATPSGGSTFTGWSGNCSGTGTCVLTMTAPMSANAAFTGSGSSAAVTLQGPMTLTPGWTIVP